MDFKQAKDKIKEFEDEISQLEQDLNKLNRKISLCNSQINYKKRDVKQLNQIIKLENAFDSVSHIDGYNMLSTEELQAISNGMDKIDYTKYNSSFPRWIDFEKLIKEVIEFKKQYEGFVLDKIVKTGQLDTQLDTLPPQNIYKFTYKTPHGHYFTCGGIEF